jgi:hypothetical protein
LLFEALKVQEMWASAYTYIWQNRVQLENEFDREEQANIWQGSGISDQGFLVSQVPKSEAPGAPKGLWLF